MTVVCTGACVCLLFIIGIWRCSNAQSAGDLPTDDRQDAKNHSCILPEPLGHSKFWQHPRRCPPHDKTAACQLVPGTLKPHWWLIYYNCDAGYYLAKNSRVSICNNGSWVPAFPPCIPDNCTVPVLPLHRFFLHPCASGECHLTPGQTVSDGAIIGISCEHGFHLRQHSSRETITICSAGRWRIDIPDCVKLCPPLKSQTVDFQCYQGLTLVPCDKPMLPGTTVLYSCKQYHEASNRNEITSMKCNQNGQWSKNMPSCTPKCGISNLDGGQIRPTIVGGNFSEPGNFPWHAGVFHRVSDKWEAKCGGTLISARAILTAAHCVTINSPIYKSPTMDPKDVMVSLGKNFRLWDSIEATGIKRQVKEILVHPDYVGSALNYANDIAIIKLETEAPVNIYIEPACVDYNLIHLQQLKQNTLTGYVAGWGNTEDCSSRGSVCSTPSDILKFTRTTIMNFTECLKTTQKIKPLSFSFLTTDKYCAGNGSEAVVQQGDSGGGLTFQFDGLHYIYGVVSVKLKLKTSNTVYYNFGGFTSVSTHLNWLKSQLI